MFYVTSQKKIDNPVIKIFDRKLGNLTSTSSSVINLAV